MALIRIRLLSEYYCNSLSLGIWRIEDRQQQVLDIAHDGNVSRWIKAIAQWLKAIPTQQSSFAHCCQSLAMPQVEVWLGMLLGQFDLEPDEEFYSEMLWVKAAVGDPSSTLSPSRSIDACQN